MHIAAKQGNAEIIRKLLLFGADPLLWNSHGKCPVHVAAQEGYPLCLDAFCEAQVLPAFERRLRDRRFDHTRKASDGQCHILDVQDSLGMTPLHLATLRNQPEVASTLLKHSSKGLWMRDKNGRTPLDLAKLQGHKALEAKFEQMLAPGEE